jgi:hypothetical protein
MPPASATAVHNTTTSALTSGTSCWHNACGFTLIGCAYAVAAVLATREQNAYYASYALSRQDLYSDSIINFYADSMQMLCIIYALADVMQILCRYYAIYAASMQFLCIFVKVIYIYMIQFMQVLCRSYAGLMQVLFKCYANYLQIFCKFCPILCKSYTIPSTFYAKLQKNLISAVFM